MPPRSLRSAATALLFAALGSGAALGVGWPAGAAMLLFWAMIYARDVEGLPTADVCSILGISEGNQRVLLHRARARIRRHLEQEAVW